MTLPRLLLALGLLLAASSATAQATAYRCGNAYSQEPCPGGKAVKLDDNRSADQVQQARDTAQRDAAQASSASRERPAPSAKRSPSGAAGIRHATEPAVGAPSNNGAATPVRRANTAAVMVIANAPPAIRTSSCSTGAF